MKNYFELSYRTNYNVYSYNNKKIIIYEDHRCILNVLYFAKINEYIDAPINLIYFDFHDDCIIPHKEKINKIKAFIKRNPSFEKFMSFTEFNTRILDDDWLITGVELGLIKDAINIGGVETYNMDNLVNKKYIDHNKIGHEIFSISHLDFELGERGSLCDYCLKEPYYGKAREIFEFNNKNNFKFNNEVTKPFVLDFDLDCFILDTEYGRFAWNEKIFYNKYINNSRQNTISPYSFLKTLIERCEFITICRESNSCGGIGESNKILNLLDKYFFEGCLGTE